MGRATINRLSDRKAQTIGPGMHPDGGGLYLRVTKGKQGEDGKPAFAASLLTVVTTADR
jgi:hypothetical protein